MQINKTKELLGLLFITLHPPSNTKVSFSGSKSVMSLCYHSAPHVNLVTWLFRCITASATLSFDVLSILIVYQSYCNVDLQQSFALKYTTVITYINKFYHSFCHFPHLSQHHTIWFPAHPARYCYQNRLLCSIFTSYSFGLHITVHWLLVACLLWGADHVLFSPSIICFTTGYVWCHRFFTII